MLAMVWARRKPSVVANPGVRKIVSKFSGNTTRITILIRSLKNQAETPILGCAHRGRYAARYSSFGWLRKGPAGAWTRGNWKSPSGDGVDEATGSQLLNTVCRLDPQSQNFCEIWGCADPYGVPVAGDRPPGTAHLDGLKSGRV